MEKPYADTTMDHLLLIQSVLMKISINIDEHDAWWMSSPDRGGFDVDKIDSALASVGLLIKDYWRNDQTKQG